MSSLSREPEALNHTDSGMDRIVNHCALKDAACSCQLQAAALRRLEACDLDASDATIGSLTKALAAMLTAAL
jgi:hypothetical protein